MVIVKGREMIIPESERIIGTTYDNNAENRQFKIARVTTGGTDLSHLSFRLDLEYQGSTLDTSILTAEVGDDDILLTWQIPDSCVQQEGTVWVAIRAFDENGTIKWATLKGAFYVGSTIDIPGKYDGELTELDQLETRLDQKISSLDTNEAARQSAEKERESNEEERQLNEIGRQQSSNLAVTNANQAAGAAQAAAQNANSIAEDLTERLIAGEFKGEKGDTGPQGPQGESGVTAPSAGMFTLRVDSATGNLYAVYLDGSDPPKFRYDTTTGNLYFVIDEEAE